MRRKRKSPFLLLVIFILIIHQGILQTHLLTWTTPPTAPPLSSIEAALVHAAVRSKALEAIAEGQLSPGRELELISALDLGTVPWSSLEDESVLNNLLELVKVASFFCCCSESVCLLWL